MKKVIIIFQSVFLFTLFISCKKNGAGGDAELNITVKHHEKLIPGASVYIKYGAKEFPGFDLNVYDEKKYAGNSGEEAGKTKIDNLLKGDYYLFALGYDSAIFENVSGGIYVKVLKSSEIKNIEIPITE